MASDSILTVDESRKRKRSWRSTWSDLPEDLLRAVVERLCLKERIRFRAVCKNWEACPIHDIPITDKSLPWLMYYCFSSHHSICSILDPCRRKMSYVMEEEGGWDDERGSITAGSLLSTAIPCASRCGWVLFFEKMRKVVNSSSLHHVYQYYVYNPLTKVIISLPPLELPQHCYNVGGLATFTSDPTSPDYLFAVPTISHTQDEDNFFFISTLYSSNKQGNGSDNNNKTWKTHDDFPVHAMAYMGGILYCYNSIEGLSSFHVATQEWRLLSSKPTLIDGRIITITAQNFIQGSWYFIAYGGHLHLVYLSTEKLEAPECNIFKYDWLDGSWRKMESLEGGVIFIGKPSFGVPAGKHTKMVANRVYYFCSHTYIPTPYFIVYGSSSAGTRGDKYEFSDQRHQIYYEPCPRKIRRRGLGVYDRRRTWMWMEPPLLMPSVNKM